MKIGIIGTGIYAKSIGKRLVNLGNEVIFWSEQNINSILVEEHMTVTNSFKEVTDKVKVLFMLTGSKYFKDMLKSIKEYISNDTLLVIGTKGICNDGTQFCDLIEDILPNIEYGILSGPTFAYDIASLEPLGFTFASSSINNHNMLKKLLNDVYLGYSDDVRGTLINGALKNAYAIGSGMLSGFNYGDSARCLYITRVSEELIKIYKALGANKKSFNTLSGLGDLVLTCTSKNSRNFSFGTILSLNDKNMIDTYLENNTVEGYEVLNIYYKLLKEKSIDVPILYSIYEIIHNGSDPKKLIETILL